MGMPLTIQEEDNQRLQSLKGFLGTRTKVDVLRKALDVLEAEKHRQLKTERLKRAARLVSGESRRVNKEFQASSRLKKSW